MHLYAIHTWKETLLPSCNFAAKDIQKVDIYLRSSIRMDSESRALSLTGDGRHLLVGFADGTVASLSWLGKVSPSSRRQHWRHMAGLEGAAGDGVSRSGAGGRGSTQNGGRGSTQRGQGQHTKGARAAHTRGRGSTQRGAPAA